MNNLEILHQMIRSKRGVTLVELLVTVVIFMLVTTGIWSTFNSQNRVYHSQQQVAMIQQNIRAAVHVMEKQLRMAGYDPDSNGYGISSIANNSITFTYDDNSGGSRTIGFSMSGSNLMMNIGANPNILAENIYDSGGVKGFAIAYAYDNNGDGRLDTIDGTASGNIIWAIDTDGDNDLDLRLDTDGNGSIDLGDDGPPSDLVIDGVALNPEIQMSAIKAIKIWVLAQADRADPAYHEQKAYIIGRNIILTDDKVRRMELSSIVKCRNL